MAGGGVAAQVGAAAASTAAFYTGTAVMTALLVRKGVLVPADLRSAPSAGEVRAPGGSCAVCGAAPGRLRLMRWQGAVSVARGMLAPRSLLRPCGHMRRTAALNPNTTPTHSPPSRHAPTAGHFASRTSTGCMRMRPKPCRARFAVGQPLAPGRSANAPPSTSVTTPRRSAPRCGRACRTRSASAPSCSRC
jgi:hypothetical protein